MGLVFSAAGFYTALYTPNANAAGSSLGAVSLGQVEDQRIISRGWRGEAITSNQYGAAPVEWVYQAGEMFISFTVIEWTAALKAALFPFAPNANTDPYYIGQVGTLATTFAGSLVLAPVSGTPAYVNDPYVKTFPQVIVTPNSNVDVPYGTSNRKTPIAFQVIPYVDGSSNFRWGTEAHV